MVSNLRSIVSHIRSRYVLTGISCDQVLFLSFIFSFFHLSVFSQTGTGDSVVPHILVDTFPVVRLMDSSVSAEGITRDQLNEAAFLQMLSRVENEAADPARSVLSAGRNIVYHQRSVIRGSCWDFVNEIFRRTGHEQENRTTIFRSAVNGPYADPELIRPGDWIYHRNYSYRNIPHSAIFIEWVDKERRIAYTLSYAGEGRRSVARYLKYDLRKVYQVVRPGGI